METFVGNRKVGKIRLVLTVPMRNGNIEKVKYSPYPILSSYRTYEEWKPPYLPYLSLMKYVLTVPMRNGNSRRFSIKELKEKVLTVPMRNGNTETPSALKFV